jgi:4-hydroxy-tetrahydrodipicolinate reductase
MEEIHHTQKLDKPSGTAISLANSIINHTQKNSWSIENNTNENLFINVKRIDEVHGTHTVLYSSAVDSIEIKHIAHSRDGFALGALIAAEWIIGKTGVFTMKDVLNLTDSKQ